MLASFIQSASLCCGRLGHALLLLGLVLVVEDANQCEETVDVPELVLLWHLKRDHPVVNELGSNDLSAGWPVGFFVKPSCSLLRVDVFVDLIVAVIAGLALASLLFAKKMADFESMQVQALPGLLEVYPVVASLSEELQRQTFVYSFHGPLFFGEVKHLERLVKQMSGAKYIILHFANVPFADQSGSYALEDALVEFEEKDIYVIAVNMSDSVKSTLGNLGIVIVNTYDTVSDAIAHIAFGDLKHSLVTKLPELDLNVLT